MDPLQEERINLAIEKLKNELIELRNIDILLLQQLLKIHDEIQKLTKDSAMVRTQSCHNCLLNNNKLSKITSFTSFNDYGSILRQQSTPAFCNLSSSYTHLEDSMMSSSKGVFYFGDSEEDLCKDFSFVETIESESKLDLSDENIDLQKYGDMLKNNIKEWKMSKTLVIGTCLCNAF